MPSCRDRRRRTVPSTKSMRARRGCARTARVRAAGPRHQRGPATAALAHPVDRDRAAGGREAAALGLTATTRARPKAELLPDVTARLEIGSVAAAVLADPRARALFADVTADVEVEDDAVADFHTRNPLRFLRRARAGGWRVPASRAGPDRGTSTIAEHLRDAARRRPSGCGWMSGAPTWCDWPPATNIPATRASPTTPTDTDADASHRYRRHQDRRRPRRRRRRVGAHPPAAAPRLSDDPEVVWAAVAAHDRRRARRGRRHGPAVSALPRRARSICPAGPSAPSTSPPGATSRSRRVAAAVPGVPVRLGGDGLCMALGEHWRGAGQGAAFLLGMVVSTGIGGGLVLDGAPVPRAHRQRRSRRPRRRRPRRASLRLRRPRLRRGHRERADLAGGPAPRAGPARTPRSWPTPPLPGTLWR